MKLTKNFKLSEFACKDGTNVPDHLISNVQELANNLQVLRDVMNEPINLNSAYRTVEHNLSVGGSSRSQHLEAKAGDIRISSKYTANMIYELIEELIECGEMKEGGVGLYNSFVHYDVRGYKARW